MTPAPGSRLDHYEISEIIGKGGMGEVYRATDTGLPRDVAIKTSKQQFSERFARETKVIASLNHPNICTLFDVGPNYLVMEMIEGPTLAERIKQGPMSLDETATIMKQVADALDYAHEKGVVHRDLKPGNIKIRPDGLVKVLDFGLAKVGPTAASSAAAAGDADNSPTLTLGATQAGVVLGTAAYMSPEQAMGKVVDKRADVWAFGTVFYEMLTGTRMHPGDTVQEIMASVLKDEPDLTKIPAQAHRLIKRCLEKDPNKRLRHVGDVMALLDDAPSASGSGPISGSQTAIAALPPERTAKKWLWPGIAGAAVLIAAAAAGVLYLKPAAPARASRFQITLPDNVEFQMYVSVSPDGHKLVFTATGQQSGIWIRDLDTLEWRRLTGTEGALSPFWSPDSRFLGFAVGSDLKKIEVAGGPPQTLCTVPGSPGTGAWGRDGVIVFGGRSAGSPMRRVSASGGVPVDLTSVDTARGEVLQGLPTFLPDGKHFLYLRQGTTEVAGIYAGSVDAKPAEQSKERILAAAFGAPYVDGNLFFMREGTLMVQPFDAGKLQLRGEPVPVAEHVGTFGSAGYFSVSPAGVLAYRTGASTGMAVPLQPTWFDRQGKTTGTIGQPSPDVGLVLSPDATHAAGRDDSPTRPGDIWLLDFARGVRTRFTFRQTVGSLPVWSPDGSRIVFAAGSTLDTIYEKATSGAGEEKELLKRPVDVKLPTSWSRDGRFLLYTTAPTPITGAALWVLPLGVQEAGDRKPVLLLGTQFNASLGSFSPDGRWIAYVSNESGRNEVYVRPFVASGSAGPGASHPPSQLLTQPPPQPRLGEGKWQVSKDGAAATGAASPPKWRNDGKEIVFAGPNNAMMAVDVNGTGAAFQMGTPQQLFTAPANAGWDVTADGKRFLMTVLPGQGQQAASTPITVVLNWQADLKK
jgi:eukaryotic-like serine/threonine-protein kinase